MNVAIYMVMLEATSNSYASYICSVELPGFRETGAGEGGGGGTRRPENKKRGDIKPYDIYYVQ